MTQARQMQAAIVVALDADPAEADVVAALVQFSTAGDRILDRRLLEIGGKGLFTQELEAALLDGRVDCAVHSLKDMPSDMPDGLVIAATPEREDPRDAFLSPAFAAFADLPQGARLGTASLRRQTQSLHLRPDLQLVNLRGNIDTRLAKLDAGECDGALLALAGLKRLGLEDRVRERLDPYERPPAPGQGALAIQTRVADAGAAWVLALDHRATALCVAAERGALEALEGSCRTAIGAHARLDGLRLLLVVEALTPDGAQRFRREAFADNPGIEAARALGQGLGRAIREEAGDRLLLPV